MHSLEVSRIWSTPQDKIFASFYRILPRRRIETKHEQRRDHACPYCEGVAFGAKSSLKTHTKTVHEKRRDHVCGNCKGVALETASTLKKHIDVAHLQQRRKVGWK